MRTHFVSVLKRHVITAGLVLAVLFLLQSSLLAQQTGSITGTAFDSTGAVIPGAKVTLINEATHDKRPTVSNGEGYFAFAAVMPGNYTVTVEANGFKGWTHKGINILPGDKKNVAATLIIGATNEVVTVEGKQTEVQLVDSGERSATLSSKDIKNLALKGRDVTELVRTLPGFNIATAAPNGSALTNLQNSASYDTAVTGIGSGVGTGYNSNGLNRGGQDLVSDGAHVIDPGCNCGATQTINVDMVEEVKVQTSNFSAEAAKGPVVINAVGKSGTATYHGEGRLNIRNGALNSFDWNTKKAFLSGAQGAAKPDDKYWYPGGSISGPVRLPFSDWNRKNPKMFFFAGFEYYNQFIPDTGGLLQAYVPTLGMRKGDFTLNGEGNAAFCGPKGPGGSLAAVCSLPTDADLLKNNSWMPDPNNPGHSLPITNGIIPTSAMDPAGLAIMKMIPLPNADPTTTPNGYNYVQQLMLNQNGDMFHSKVDYNFSDLTKLNISYNLQTQTSYTPVMLFWQPPQSVPFPGNMTSNPWSHTISANFTKAFHPTLTNEFVATLAYLNNGLQYANEAGVSRKALGYPYQGVFKNGSDIMPALSNGWYIPGYPMIYQADASHYQSKKLLPTIADNLSKTYRTHFFKAGFYYETAGNKQSEVNYANGQAQFNQYGPYCVLDFYGCDGKDATVDRKIGTPNPVANMLLGASNLYTEYNYLPVYNMSYKVASFYLQDSWKIRPRLTLDFGARIEHEGAWTDNHGVGLAAFRNQWYLTDMALDPAKRPAYPGMRWHAIDKSIPISGRKVQALFASPRFGLAWDIFGKGNTVVRGGFGAYRWNDQYNDVAGAMGSGVGMRSYSTGHAYYLKDIDKIGGATGAPNLTSGAFAVNPDDDQQPLTYTYSMTISQKAPWSSLLEVAYVGSQSENMNISGNLINKNVIPVGAFFLPDPVTNTAPPVNLNSGLTLEHYRPYQAYSAGALNIYNHGAYANYNALQVSWNRQKGSFLWGANYTFSKTLGIQGDANPFSLDANYNVVNQDRTHALNLNYTYMLGNRIHGIHPLVRAVVNGWTLSGITTLQSGPNLQAAYGGNLGLQITGDHAVTNRDMFGTDALQMFPIVTCNPASGLTKAHQYINGDCFAAPSIGNNGPLHMPYIHGPAYLNSDLSIGKSFSVTERQKVEFKAAAFNFLNHALWSFDPNSLDNIKLRFAADANGTLVITPQNKATYGVTNTKFGRRIVEFTLKYTF